MARRPAEPELHIWVGRRGREPVRCPLTDLPNRLLLQEHTRMALNRARRNDRQVALLHIGLDDFRLINDSLGRQAGDRVLREVAQRMEGTVPDVLVLVRVAGDEFAALIADLGPGAEQVVESVAGHIRGALDDRSRSTGTASRSA